MYSLVMKDILMQKKYLLFSLVYIIFFVFVLQAVKEGVYPATLTGICYMLVATACAYDDKNKSDVMLNSLPIKRSTIVIAKYVSILVYFAIGTVGYLVIMALIKFISLPLQVYPITLPGWLAAVLAITLLNGIYLPFYFKLGYIKSKFVNFVLFFGLFAGVTSAMTLVTNNGWLPDIISFVEGYSHLLITIIVVFFSMALLALSYALSLKVYNSREF